MRLPHPATASLAVTHLDRFPGRPTLVFLHDSLGCIALWRDFPERLGALTQCNVFVYDRHGYGQSGPLLQSERSPDYLESEAAVLAALLDDYALHSPILFGHSDGGSIALLTAALYPEKVAAVITEGAHVLVEEITLAGIREAIVAYQHTDLKEKLEKYHGAHTEAMFRAWTDTWTAEHFSNWNITSFLPAIVCPVLVIQGEADEFGSEQQVDSIVSGVSGKATKLYIPDIKHSPHKEAPEYILTQVAAFIHNLELL